MQVLFYYPSSTVEYPELHFAIGNSNPQRTPSPGLSHQTYLDDLISIVTSNQRTIRFSMPVINVLRILLVSSLVIRCDIYHTSTTASLYETVIKEWEDRMEKAATTASSLEAEQDSGNINRTQSMATLNESFPLGTGLDSGPRVNTLRSGEDNMKLKELMELCTKLHERALDLA
ncbi:hypothetical protein Tco_0793838 [Tanacetum coccineum]